ncbi:MAG: amidohydrolase family protein [Gemmatimonadetes bacterium]|nr:amidohydrolase family protein [Gemmatimonadota bacterium]
MRRPSPGSSVRTGLRLLAAAVPALLVACATGDATTESADLVLTNGKVVTVDDALGEAQAVAVRGDRILAVGTTEEMEDFVGADTEVVDLEGRLAIPGFIEGHGHYLGLGNARMILDLTTATTWQEIVAMVERAAAEAEPGEWILGRGWHQEKWSAVPEPSVDGVPLHGSLSAASPDNPVLLTHASGHASFANALAMERAGLTRDTPDPAGGTIVKDARGEPTGLLRETASGIVGRARADAEASMTDSERETRFRRQVELAGEEALANGVTSFHDAGTGFDDIDRLKAMADAGELPVRLYVMVRGESHEDLDARLDDYFMDGHANGFLTVRSIKQVVDGALGSHGAWLLEPYADMPSSTGLPTQQPADIERTAEIAIRHGFQVNTHAIGDRGNREVLDLYQRVFEANPDHEDLRWRIEHDYRELKQCLGLDHYEGRSYRGLHHHLTTGSAELAHAGRRQADAVLVRLDLARDADTHARGPHVIRACGGR